MSFDWLALDSLEEVPVHSTSRLLDFICEEGLPTWQFLNIDTKEALLNHTDMSRFGHRITSLLWNRDFRCTLWEQHSCDFSHLIRLFLHSTVFSFRFLITNPLLTAWFPDKWNKQSLVWNFGPYYTPWTALRKAVQCFSRLDSSSNHSFLVLTVPFKGD
jgi:hypothetical protein